MAKPISFFVHHQGRGHAQRTMAIVRELPASQPVSVLTADPSLFDGFERDIEIVPLPNMIGAPVPTPALYDQPTPAVMHCVPLGLAPMRQTMRRILDHLDDRGTGLFVIDVSAELALLARIASVPAIKIRMHGNRSDAGHTAAYDACTGMLAPFDARLEQPDYPDWARAKTFYSGGLCTSSQRRDDRAEARRALGLPAERELVVAITGGGGAGTPYAPLTMAARAAPDTLFVTVGPLHREGHETDFANLVNHGWVSHTSDYIAAADIVIASAGDNTVHEIMRTGRPYICAPEWRYFDEQQRKAESLAAVGAAIHLPRWPGDLEGWRDLLERARALDIECQRGLHDPHAAARAAGWLMSRMDTLWQEETRQGRRAAPQVSIAATGT
ncbi:LPS N-acetylglucosamine transferase [Salinisphaera sp. T5B8]|uniref:glycosyltransferase n=1 Tax=Salinisphaera sp. T5B8 TaxID=1304154 RepID=UPI003342001B